MEKDKESTLSDIYKLYIDGDKDSFIREYETFKKTKGSLLTDFLDLFIKYKFPCEDIIKYSLDNDNINLAKFFTYFLNAFIKYYNSLDNVKDISEEQNFPYTKFFYHIL